MATTWVSGTTNGVPVATGAATTGTEAGPPTGTDGLNLANMAGFSLYVEAAGAMTAGGTLQAWLKNAVSGNWQRAPDLDVTVQALTKQGFTGFSVANATGYVAFLPSGIGQASSVYLVGSYFKRGN